MHLWFPEIRILKKKSAATLRPPEFIYSVDLDEKGPEIKIVHI